MKQGIHPEYLETQVTCSCGNKFTTRSTKSDLHVELCDQCHPFYTGKQKLVDTGGRVERFQKKYAKRSQPNPADAAPESDAAPEAEQAPEPNAAPEAEQAPEPDAPSSELPTA